MCDISSFITVHICVKKYMVQSTTVFEFQQNNCIAAIANVSSWKTVRVISFFFLYLNETFKKSIQSGLIQKICAGIFRDSLIVGPAFQHFCILRYFVVILASFLSKRLTSSAALIKVPNTNTVAQQKRV